MLSGPSGGAADGNSRRVRGEGDKASATIGVCGIGDGGGSATITSVAASSVEGGVPAAAAAASTTAAAPKHSNSALSSLGEASGACFLLGNHAKFGLAERCW